MNLRLEIPGIELESEHKVRRMHWAAVAKKSKAKRAAVKLWWQAKKLPKQVLRPGQKAIVILTRFGIRDLDGDNLQGAFKAVRDEVAELLGIDDGSPDIAWHYRQEHRAEYGLSIAVEVREGRACG